MPWISGGNNKDIKYRARKLLELKIFIIITQQYLEHRRRRWRRRGGGSGKELNKKKNHNNFRFHQQLFSFRSLPIHFAVMKFYAEENCESQNSRVLRENFLLLHLIPFKLFILAIAEATTMPVEPSEKLIITWSDLLCGTVNTRAYFPANSTKALAMLLIPFYS